MLNAQGIQINPEQQIQIWASKAVSLIVSHHTEPGPVVQCLSAETEADTKTS